METKTAGRRELAKKVLAELLSDKFPNFPILIIGERGTGKSRMVQEAAAGNAVVANCASFADDQMAESALFGYEGGAFTGAKKGGDTGLFHEADNKGKKEANKKSLGILFLDEIHHLSKRCQAKLNLALQMEKNLYKNVRRLGSSKPENPMQFKLVAATNITDINKLYKEYILPDFYDRISQNIITIPSLRDTPEHREQDWKSNWTNMQFDTASSEKSIMCPNDEKLITWLKTLDLYGNFRDLQKIAISYTKFERFDDEIKGMLEEKNAFDYAKNQFEKWKSPAPEIDGDDIDIKLNSKKNASELIKDFRFALQDWAIKQYGDKESAASVLRVDPKTLDNWKKKY